MQRTWWPEAGTIIVIGLWNVLISVLKWIKFTLMFLCFQAWIRKRLKVTLCKWGCRSVTWKTSGLNSSWPCDAIWHHGSMSTLAQVMACCLMLPIYYLNQCWFVISEVLWHSPNEFENYTFKITARSPRENQYIHWGIVIHWMLLGINELPCFLVMCYLLMSPEISFTNRD